jgi:ATP-dependent RNA helicase RhlE
LLFQDLKLIEPLLKALHDEGYTTPTPIQQQSIPIILNRKDLLGCAQTGTGKTAAFALPLLQLMQEDTAQQPAANAEGAAAGTADPMAGHQDSRTQSTGNAPVRHLRTGHEHRREAVRPIRALILTPTRELAIQIGESFAAYGKYTKLKHLVIFGGVPQQSQVQALQRGIDILVATPGRLLDLCDQRYVHLRDIQFFVLDEADRMLDMGFVHDVKKIITKLPQKRQTLFFSATMPPEIQKLAGSILVNPEKVEVTPVSSTAETIQQALYFVEKKDKRSLLLHLLKDDSIPTALVFTRTKHGADKVAQGLTRAGIRAEAIHGNKSQNARQRALQSFKARQTRILVATDIAARGIDIDELTHVINFELPNVPETYVHRIGRTGRAGASGIALSFCDAEEKEYLHDIQKLIGLSIPVAGDHPYVMHGGLSVRSSAPAQESRGGRREPGQNNRNDRGGRQGGNQNQRPPQQRGAGQPGNRRPLNQQVSGQPPVNRRPINQDNQAPEGQPPVHNRRPSNQQPITKRPVNQDIAGQPPVNTAPADQQPIDRQPIDRQPADRQPVKRPVPQQSPTQSKEDYQAFIAQHAVNQASGDEKW